MEITKEMLVEEIKTLRKASSIHAKYSIAQYRKVLKVLQELEGEKKMLQKKVRQRTEHLEVEIKNKEDLASKLEKVAKYDQLTGLANRYLFLKELRLIHEEANLLGKTFTLLFIDLDGFKFINDTYGHNIGDKVLQVIASRIKSLVRNGDLVSRLGGDEFTVILKNMDRKQKIENIALNIIYEIKKEIKIKNLSIYVGSSIGIYLYDERIESYQDLVSKADIAMYEAKKAGKGTYMFFGKNMQKELRKATTIKSKLKNALKNNEFINYFQPIVSSTNYKVKGMEVLLRWERRGKIIGPGNFIHILEEDVWLIEEVTFWQIEEVAKLLENYDMFFSINISAKLLSGDRLISKIKEVVSKYSFDTAKIYFEVTETSLSANLSGASKILIELRDMGFNLSLDDFGTGYSSLAYLRELPFNTLKIDKKFIDNVKYSNRDKQLLCSIVDMAKTLKMKVVLEGIEIKEQLDMLKKDIYIKYQGFYFYKPMEFKDIKKILSS